MKLAYCQKWEESERGWGTRPDGYSLHASESDARKFLAAFAKLQEAAYKRSGGHVPDEYSRPSGTLYECPVSDKIYAALLKALPIHGVYDSTLRHLKLVEDGRYPFPGGADGWCSKAHDLAHLDKEEVVVLLPKAEPAKEVETLPQQEFSKVVAQGVAALGARALADKFEVSVSTIGRWCAGISTPAKAIQKQVRESL